MGADATKIWIYGSHMCFTRQPSSNKAMELLSWSPSLLLMEWERGCHLRWAHLDPSALFLLVSPLSHWIWTDFCKSSFPTGSLLYYQSFQAPNFKTDFNSDQSGTGLKKKKNSLITFLVDGRKQFPGGSQHMGCKWRCVTWNLEPSKYKVPHRL